MTNARRTTKSARKWFCCGEATGTTQNVVRIWWLSAVTLVFGLLAAAPVRAVCINDGQGPDDQPGQKDLSGLCEPGPTCSSSATTLSLLWQFDDVNWTGNNTGDACALIDLNQDGLADRAVCVTVFGAAQMAGKCSNNQFLGCCRFRRSRTARPTEGEHLIRAKPNTSSERRRAARPEPRDRGVSTWLSSARPSRSSASSASILPSA